MEHSIKLFDIITTALKAGEIISDIYLNQNDFLIQEKADSSPLTIADQASHHYLASRLAELDSSIPILSEEGKEIPFESREEWGYFWLIDPLDGTKEFINKNGEFTVNIALIFQKQPVLSVIYAPVKKLLYFAKLQQGAYKLAGTDLHDLTENELFEHAEKLPLNKEHSGTRIITSRSHISDQTNHFINQERRTSENIETIPMGSSLKLCLIAEGKADVYPRFEPTMEWDTAAGQLIVEESGGSVIRLPEMKEKLFYNKKVLINPSFIALTKNSK